MYIQEIQYLCLFKKSKTMQIPLDQFEQVIDEKILQRGLTYFKKGHVQELEEISPNTYEAIVEGTEDYTVRLTVENNVVTDYNCDCPYDLGPVCKHVAAVIFSLQEEELGLTKKAAKSKKSAGSGTKKSKSVATQIDELMDKASVDELKELIRTEAKKNAMFRNHVLSHLEHYNENISKDLYQKQLKAMIRSATDRYGLIDWNKARALGRAVYELLDSAKKQIDHGSFEKAAMVCFAVMEEMLEALNGADDSNGDIGGCIDEATNLLDEMAARCESKTVRKQIFDFCADEFEKGRFAGWDWHEGLLSSAANLAETDADFDRVLALAEKKQQSDWANERIQMIKYGLLVKKKGQDIADKFLEQNMDNSRFREMAIERALEQKNYAKAVKLAQDGVKTDMKDKPGLAKEWYDWLLKIAQAQKDTPKILEYASYLLIDNFRNEQDYYQILKEYVKPEEWDAFVNAIVHEIKAKRRWYDTGLVATIYIREEKWDKLWEMVKENPTLSTIEQYESYLSKHYAGEMVDLYASLILDYLERNMGRDHYQTACRYIRRMIKLGGKAKADHLIAQLRTLYAKRPTLMQELDRV